MNYIDLKETQRVLENIAYDAVKSCAPRPAPNTKMVASFSHVFEALTEYFPNAPAMFRFLEYMARTLPGNKVPGVKLIRHMTGLGLKDSKDFVDYIENEFSPRNDF